VFGHCAEEAPPLLVWVAGPLARAAGACPSCATGLVRVRRGAGAGSEAGKKGRAGVFFFVSLFALLFLFPRRPPSLLLPPMAGQQHYVKAGRHPVLEAGYKVREGKGGARLPFRAGRRRMARAARPPRAVAFLCAPTLPPLARQLAHAAAACACSGKQTPRQARGGGGADTLARRYPDCSPFSPPLFSSSCAATRSTSRSCWVAPWSGSG
jgi:hypothetical protein